MIPLLDMGRDIKGLDKLVNGWGVGEAERWLKPFCPHRLIIARLAGNPDLDALYEKYKALKGGWGGNSIAKINGEADKLMEYLRHEVKPMV